MSGDQFSPVQIWEMCFLGTSRTLAEGQGPRRAISDVELDKEPKA